MDPYNITDKMDDTTLDVIATRLEARGKHPFFLKVLEEYLDAMNIDDSSKVLDMGCGTGVATRAVASRQGFSGMIKGIDLSPYLAGVAEQLASSEGLGEYVEFQAGDTRNLDINDGEYDAVIAHTLVSHVDDPVETLKEAFRVVKPGGLVGIFDGDYASMTFAQEDAEKAKELDEVVVSAVVTSPQVMRQMPRIFQAVGLEVIDCFPYVLAEVGEMDFWKPGIESLRILLPKSGAMTEGEANKFADDLVKDSERGIFFGASNFYAYIGRRP